MDYVILPDGTASFSAKAHKILGPDASPEDVAKKAEELSKEFPNAAQEAKLAATITDHIYSHYSQVKQAQDATWSESYKTKLVAAGVPDLEATVVTIISNGGDIETACADAVTALSTEVKGRIQGATKQARFDYATAMLLKLVKIGIRTEWAEICIHTATKQSEAGQEIVFPPYPDI